MTHFRCAGPVARREFMQVGALALGGLSLADLLKADAAAGTKASDTAVILLYLHGGPSHLETYDLKPNAPSAYRSVFAPITTRVSGMEMCELFPRQAEVADRIALVRSLHHTMSSHSDGGIEVLTGKTPTQPDPASQSKSEHPDLGHVASKLLGAGPGGMPPYLAIPQAPYMTRPAYLGVHHQAFVLGDPSVDSYRPPMLRIGNGQDAAGLEDRRRLLGQLDRLRARVDGRMSGVDEFRRQAFDMLTSARTSEAFDIGREPDTLRDRYGRNLWGQSCLLARRLAEAGTRVISLYINTPRSGDEFTNWDDHILNAGRPGHFARYMSVRLPYYDQALAALIEDIYQRGMDQRIMVVAMGEFGRTPRLSENASGTGRNHWPQAYSVLFSGGGLRVGQVVGATNSRGEYPTQRPYSPKNVLATIYRHLGIDPQQALMNHAGRPVAILDDSQPITELV